MKSNVPSDQPESGHVARYEPDRVRSLMRAIKGELEALQGREIPYEELAAYAGQSRSSVFDKLQRAEQPQVEALLRWIERLPESVRMRLVNSACRCYPTLESPRLNHDPAQVSHLKTLLRQSNGLTIVQGGNDGLRTFLVTAMAHTCTILEPERRHVCGIDAHEPDWFVPVDDVVYLHNLLDHVRLRERVRSAWPRIAEMRSRLTILNAVWPGVRELRGEVRELAQRRHFVLADDMRFRPEDLAQWRLTPSHLLTVNEEREHRIHVTVQPL